MRFGTENLQIPTQYMIERNVARFEVHPKYQQRRAYFDAAIAFSDKLIEFTEYVRPICLPMTPVDDEDYLAGDFVTLSGWGQKFDPESRIFRPTNNLKLHTLQVNPQTICEEVFSRDSMKKLGIPVRILIDFSVEFKSAKSGLSIFRPSSWLRSVMAFKMTSIVLEMNGWWVMELAMVTVEVQSSKEFPVSRKLLISSKIHNCIFIAATSSRNTYFEQHFIVSTGIECSLKATIYTRVTNRDVLYWIQNVTDTFPILMVVGGYNEQEKLLNDVELISTRPGNLCSKHVRPIFGKVSAFLILPYKVKLS